MKNQYGAVLLMILVGVALMGLMAGIAGSSWQTYLQKSKEADLLWKGAQIRDAIGYYYEFEAAGSKKSTTSESKEGVVGKAYPKSLEDLLEDPRALEITRHLRSLYPDPITGGEWDLIRSPKGGGIMGVRSISTLKPFKQYGFSVENKDFAAQENYASWKFVYTPKKIPKKPTKDVQSKPVKVE